MPPLLELLDQAYGAKRAWHGTALRGGLRGITPRQAVWRPGPGRHNIWELVLHIAYWKYAVTQQLVGGQRGAFPRSPADWPAVPARPTAAAWKADVALLHAQHRNLRRAVAAVPASRLSRKPQPNARWTILEMVVGVGAHDLYHLGQIQLIKRLAK